MERVGSCNIHSAHRVLHSESLISPYELPSDKVYKAVYFIIDVILATRGSN